MGLFMRRSMTCTLQAASNLQTLPMEDCLHHIVSGLTDLLSMQELYAVTQQMRALVADPRTWRGATVRAETLRRVSPWAQPVLSACLQLTSAVHLRSRHVSWAWRLARSCLFASPFEHLQTFGRICFAATDMHYGACHFSVTSRSMTTVSFLTLTETPSSCGGAPSTGRSTA